MSSIFYEEEIGGDYNQDTKDFTNPNGKNNSSDDNLYDEFNRLGDSYIKIKEYTSIFHDEVITEKCGKTEGCKKEACGSKNEGCKKEACGSKNEGCKKEACGSKNSVKESFSFLDVDII